MTKEELGQMTKIEQTLFGVMKDHFRDWEARSIERGEATMTKKEAYNKIETLLNEAYTIAKQVEDNGIHFYAYLTTDGSNKIRQVFSGTGIDRISVIAYILKDVPPDFRKVAASIALKAVEEREGEQNADN